MESQMNVDVEVTAATDNHVHECNVLECHEPAVGECNEVDSTEKGTRMDDFVDSESWKKVGPPTTSTLKSLPKINIHSNLSAFFKPKVVGG